jgi:excisionase family DNA binding protein
LLSYPEAARYLGCGERHVHRLASEGDVPKIRLGRRVLFAQEDLDGYVDRLRRSL